MNKLTFYKNKRECKYCGKEYKEVNVYDGFCSWACKSKYNKKHKYDHLSKLEKICLRGLDDNKKIIYLRDF